jgi:hypothetical protein
MRLLVINILFFTATPPLSTKEEIFSFYYYRISSFLQKYSIYIINIIYDTFYKNASK